MYFGVWEIQRNYGVCFSMFATIFNLNSKKFFPVVLASLGVLFVLGFMFGSNPVYATIITCSPSPCIVYDYQSPPNTGVSSQYPQTPQTWYFIGHGAVMNITDTSANTQQPITATIQAFDATGAQLYDSNNVPSSFSFPLTYLPDPLNLGTFQSNWLNFTSGNNDASNYKLHVVIGGTVQVTYSNAAPQSARIVDSTELYPIPTSGMPVQPVTTYRASCTSSSGDAICDSWKDQTVHPGSLRVPYTYSGTNYVYTMYCGNSTAVQQIMQNDPNAPYDPICPTIGKKEIYIQVDWMKRHHPDPRALANVTNAFAQNGVILHIQLGNEVPHYADSTTPPSPGASTLPSQWSDFDKIKKWYFGTAYERGCTTSTSTLAGSPFVTGSNCANAVTGNLTGKRQIFHYVLFGHFNAANPYSSGTSEEVGNDMGIYLGHFTAAVGSLDQQQGTFMHELGHNLGLYHGGGLPPDSTNPEWDNCKPNYLSVMSYTRQFAESYPINRALNYSSGYVSSLDKSSLDECAGVTITMPPPMPPTTAVSQQMVYATPNNSYMTSPIKNGNLVEWNADATKDGSTCNDGTTNQQVNINNFSPVIAVCNAGFGSTDNVLNDHNDWSNLNYNLRSNSNFYDGFSPPKTLPPCTNSTTEDPNNCIANPPPYPWGPNAQAPEITIDDVTKIRVSRVMGLYPFTLQIHNAMLGGEVLATANDLSNKDLYHATNDLLKLKSDAMSILNFKDTETRNAASILDGILNSLKIANTVAYSSHDQTHLVTCDEKWMNISPLQQYEVAQSPMTTNLKLNLTYINGLTNSLHTDGCSIPKVIMCKPSLVLMKTNLGTAACVSSETSTRLIGLNINWTLANGGIPITLITPTPPSPIPAGVTPTCPFGTNSDGSCKTSPSTVGNSTGMSNLAKS